MFRHICYAVLAILCLSCSKSLDLGQPVVDVEMFDADAEYIIVIGDIQQYTYEKATLPFLEHTMRWIYLAKEAGMNIKCILQVGDITQENKKKEWQAFHELTAAVAKEIPYAACTGNHDYSWGDNNEILSRDNTYFTKYVTFDGAKAEVVARYEPDRMENIVVRNSIFGTSYDILVMEFGPRTEVIEWANEYVKSNPGIKYILLTHEFLTSDGELVSNGSYAESQLRNTTWSSPEQLWNTLVAGNDNIACVVCGHNGFSRIRLAANDAGREVPQILFNLQYQVNGGDGMIEIWEMKEDSDSVNVGVYNTLRNKWVDTPETSFKFKYRY